MTRIYLTAVDVLPAAIVLVPLFFLFYFTAYKRNVQKTTLYCLFCLYLSAVFILVGIPNVTYFRPSLNLNLIPLHGIVDDLKNSILNIVLFVPLGVFLPVLWVKFRKGLSAVQFGFFFSLSIELMQMLTFRATDVNDLITNTVGTALGCLLVRPLVAKCAAIGTEDRDVYVLCALAFGIMFFLHPFLSPFIWDSVL